jgi:malonyl-CoA/methylmalonyl-CoA synthetase
VNPLYDALFGRHRGAGTPFLILPDGAVLSHGDFLAQAARLAHALTESGLRPGDRLAAQVAKSPAALALYAACAQAGIVFLPLNTAYTPTEVDYFIADSGAALVVCDTRAKADLAPIAGRHGARLATLDADGGGSLSEQAAAMPAAYPTVPRATDDLAALLYTSGTTGRSKGAMLSQQNLLSNAQTLAALWRFGADDVLLHALPIFHTRLFVSGSAPLLADTHARFRERTGHAILERYGMTETNMNTSNPYDGERRPGTVGFPLPGVELRVADPATGTELPTGEVGQIEVRGPNLFQGYWRMPEKTAEEMRADGFFQTGDLGRIDADGYVHIVGRAKDLIISGGYNIYPKEIEQVLDAQPGVQESAVIGVPCPDFGEAVLGLVVATPGHRPDLDAAMDAVRQALARFKHPRRLILVDALPRNSMGKVQKNVLRETHAEAVSSPAG